jgi:hemoglobin
MSSFSRRLRFVALLTAVAVALPVMAAASSTTTTSTTSKSTKTKTLYTQLGSKKGITAVVDDFVANLKKDTRVESFFAATFADPQRTTAFKTHLVDQICQASGGPCKYTGKDMKAAHEGMGIKTEHFNAVVEDLTAALDKHKVPADAKNQLIGVLGPMKPEIAGSDE